MSGVTEGLEGCAECVAVLSTAHWVVTGEDDVLVNMCNKYDDDYNYAKPDMDKFNALIKAGAPIRTQVRRN